MTCFSACLTSGDVSVAARIFAACSDVDAKAMVVPESFMR